VTGRPLRYCSQSCKRKNPLNANYFDTITDSNVHTLGQVIASGFVFNEVTIMLRSDEITLNKIQSQIGSNFPLMKSEFGRFQIKIDSRPFVRILQECGLSNNPYFQEFPPYDILTGLLDTDYYSEKDGKRYFKHHSHKLLLEMQLRLGGEIITETYKDVPRGCLGCWWILVY